MKFLILSDDPTGKILGDRLIQERHEVWLYKSSYYSDSNMPLVNTVAQAINLKPDVTIHCARNMQLIREQLSNLGLRILGGSKLQADLEQNRETAIQFCKAFGVRFLKSTTKKYIPLSTEVWFINGDPIYKYMGYIKQNRFLAGDLGVETDGESTVFWAYQNRASESIERIFSNGLFNFLKSIKYSGPFAIDSFISLDDHYPYTNMLFPRFQASSLVPFLSLYSKDISFVLSCMISGDETSVLLDDEVSISCKLSLPPYPYKEEGFLKFVTAKGNTFKEARNNLKDKIIEEHIADIPNIQFRIDAGKQGEYLEELKAIYRFS